MLLAHDVSGSGPAVLLLHSTVCDRRMWDPQVPALTAAGHQVVRCDLRGWGDSPVPIGAEWDNAADIAALLDSLGISRTAIVGASGGGRVALEFAVRWPEHVTALALLCTALRGHEPSAALRAFGDREDALLEAGDIDGATELNVDLWLGPEAGEKERALVRQMQRHAFDVQLAAERAEKAEKAAAAPATAAGQPEAAAQKATAADQPEAATAPTATTEPAKTTESTKPTEPDLTAITAPALLVSGAHDLPDFHEIATHLTTRLPHARHEELPWAGHLPNLERPDLTNPLLISFLAETR
ncbi:alpha/beta hydrolase [Actinoplanes sp. NPDC023936]|uniref:alpha/beta fold hydrolase n=1 Tax=Actinoplanes sp. NPDC023936 TaxID=3154910 RepID=UPI0033D7FE7D